MSRRGRNRGSFLCFCPQGLFSPPKESTVGLSGLVLRCDFVGEVDGAAGLGGAAGGVEDADNGDVGVERGEVAVRFEGAVEDGGEVVEGVVVRCGEGGCVFDVLGWVFGEADAEFCSGALLS